MAMARWLGRMGKDSGPVAGDRQPRGLCMGLAVRRSAGRMGRLDADGRWDDDYDTGDSEHAWRGPGLVTMVVRGEVHPRGPAIPVVHFQ